jgi:hypothetical protein
MAYDEFQADRIRKVFHEKKVQFIEKKMIGGLCFMVDDKMCLGTHIDKKSNQPLLMARIGEAAYIEAIQRPGAHPMDFTGRPMKGYIFVDQDGMDMNEDLEYWVQLALDFNPMAKASKKRKRKSNSFLFSFICNFFY